MKAIQITRYGGPEVMKFVEVPIPQIAPNQGLVKLQACGVNFIDVYQRTGLYKVQLPYILGLEGAGVVEEVDSDVGEFVPGDRVAYVGGAGSYAEYALVPTERLIWLPDEVSFEHGAAVMLQGMTAHYLAHSTYPLKFGDTCLIHAAAGGVGLLLIQIAKRCGARVIGTVSTEEKAALAKEVGADHIILYTQRDFATEVKRLTEGKGVNVVYDSVGKDTFDKGINCLSRQGYMVLFGQSSGPVQPIDPQLLNAKGSLFLTRPSLFHYIADRDNLEKRANEVLNWVATGELKVRIGQKFPLSQAAEAHRNLEGRNTTGKVLLIP